MELVLVRHGKAEKLIPDLTDFNRQLTRDGRRQVKDAVAGLALYLSAAFQVQIWTSPLVRAWQTAKLLAEGMGNVSLTERKALQNGNLQELSAFWQDLSDRDAVLVVGHEPYLSDWCRQLTGVELPFKISTAVGIEIKDPKVLQGKLRWYAQTAILARLGQSAKKI